MEIGGGEPMVVRLPAVDTSVGAVPCALAAKAALIAATSLLREAICSLTTCAAALLDKVTSPKAFVIMVRSSSSPSWSPIVLVLLIIPDINFLPCGPEVIKR